MIELKDVVNIHNLLIDKFSGSSGIRDMNLLESAINRPWATFDQQDLYANPLEKAAAILESILINHPFVDGNKRTAYVLMRLILLENELDISASEDEKYKLVIGASKGEIRFDGIKLWIESHVIKRTVV